MWAANALTASRLVFAFAFWATYATPAWSIAWVILAAASDALDGRLARRARRRAGAPDGVPVMGDWLDPAADKLFVLVAVAAIGAHERDAWPLIACLGARELLLAPLLIAYGCARAIGRARALPLRAHAIGKVATVAQLVAIVTIVAPGTFAAAVRWPAAIIAGTLGVAAVVEQVARTRIRHQGARR